MNCYTHDRTPAVGVCAVCQKAVCRKCVGMDTPRVVCTTCVGSGAIAGFEFRSRASVGKWPLVHICAGVDPISRRPRIARGVIAIGNFAVGVVAVGGFALGIATIGGVSLGLVLALGGVALGVGMSWGGVAVGSIAVGGVAVGFVYAIGGVAVGPAVIDARHCDAAARQFADRWLQFAAAARSCR